MLHARGSSGGFRTPGRTVTDTLLAACGIVLAVTVAWVSIEIGVTVRLRRMMRRIERQQQNGWSALSATASRVVNREDGDRNTDEPWP